MTTPIQAANCKCVSDDHEKGGEELEIPIRPFCTVSSDIPTHSMVILACKVKTGAPTKVGIRPRFCPFCGVAYKTSDEIAAIRKERESQV